MLYLKSMRAMFAVVRTGGKQYRVAAGDKIVVEKIDGDAGASITLGDVLLAGEGSELKAVAGLTVAAEIIAQAKGEKVIVFKKRRRHNYRRKNGHRQNHTILKIVAIGERAEEGRAEEGRRAQGRSRAGRPRPRQPRPRRPLRRRPKPRPRPKRKPAAKKTRSNSRWHIRKQAVRRATVVIRPAVASASRSSAAKPRSRATSSCVSAGPNSIRAATSAWARTIPCSRSSTAA